MGLTFKEVSVATVVTASYMLAVFGSLFTQ